MPLDLRYAIGLLLATYGGILVVEGGVEHAIVLGVNVDLWWGAAMFACGMATIGFARSRRH